MVNLSTIRKLHDLTQAQFAKIIHISTPTLRAWEAGRAQPNAENLCMIADYFNVSTDFILGREAKFSAYEHLLIAEKIMRRENSAKNKESSR